MDIILNMIPFTLHVFAAVMYTKPAWRVFRAFVVRQWRRMLGRAEAADEAALEASLGAVSRAHTGYVYAGVALHVLSIASSYFLFEGLLLSALLSLFVLTVFLISWRVLSFAAMQLSVLYMVSALPMCMLLPMLDIMHVPVGAQVFSLHGVLAFAVYALAAAAFLLCLDMRMVERRLHRQPSDDAATSLLAGERRCFRYVLLSFVLLTLTLASGIGAAVAAGEAAVAWTHKQLFAYLTWGVFLLLLLGRRFAGWRGAVAQRWFFTGYAFLLLSYIGSTVVRHLIHGG